MEKEDILEKVYETAKRYELKSGGCAQCTIAAIFDVLGVEDEGVFKAATGMADGVGRYDSVFGLPGMILGAGLYAEAFPLMKQTVLTWGGGKITLPARRNRARLLDTMPAALPGAWACR